MHCRAGFLIAFLGLSGATWAEEAATFADLATQVRIAMAHRQLAASAADLPRLQTLATTDEERTVAARLSGIQDRLVRFWKSVDDGGRKVTGEEEIMIGDTLVALIEYEVSVGRISLKRLGQTKRYTAEDMPIPVALALSDLAIRRGSAASDELVGALHAMDPSGDRELARRLWTDSQRGGAETGPLLAELAVALPAAARIKVPRVSPAAAAVLDPRQWVFQVADGDIRRRVPLGDGGVIDPQGRLVVTAPEGHGTVWLTCSRKLPTNFAIRFFFLALPADQTCGVFTGDPRGDQPFAAAIRLPRDTMQFELRRNAGTLTCRVNDVDCPVEVIDFKAARAQGVFGLSLPAGARVTLAGFEVVQQAEGGR